MPREKTVLPCLNSASLDRINPSAFTGLDESCLHHIRRQPASGIGHFRQRIPSRRDQAAPLGQDNQAYCPACEPGARERRCVPRDRRESPIGLADASHVPRRSIRLLRDPMRQSMARSPGRPHWLPNPHRQDRQTQRLFCQGHRFPDPRPAGRLLLRCNKGPAIKGQAHIVSSRCFKYPSPPEHRQHHCLQRHPLSAAARAVWLRAFPPSLSLSCRETAGCPALDSD